MPDIEDDETEIKAEELRQRQQLDRDDLGNETAQRGTKIRRFRTLF